MRKRIQKSMMFILIAILVPIYLIMSVVVYQRNLKILEGEIKQEAAYIKRAVDLSGTEYLAQLDDVDQGTRVTLIDLREMFCMIPEMMEVRWRIIRPEPKYNRL